MQTVFPIGGERGQNVNAEEQRLVRAAFVHRQTMVKNEKCNRTIVPAVLSESL